MESDIQILRRRLLLMGFALFKVRDGYVIQHTAYESLKAGSEAQPLDIAAVRRFAA